MATAVSSRPKEDRSDGRRRANDERGPAYGQRAIPRNGAGSARAAAPLQVLPDEALFLPDPDFREILGDVRRKANDATKAAPPPTQQPRAPPRPQRPHPRKKLNGSNGPGDNGDSDSDRDQDQNPNTPQGGERSRQEDMAARYRAMNERAFQQNFGQNLNFGQGAIQTPPDGQSTSSQGSSRR